MKKILRVNTGLQKPARSKGAHLLRACFLLMFAGWVANANAHNYHLSFTQLEQHANSSTATILVRVFADDFEKALKTRFVGSVKLSQRQLIAGYLNEHLEIKDSRGKSKKILLTKIEQKADVFIINLTARVPEGLHGLKLRQSIFLELFDDQVNQVLIKFSGKESTLEFKSGDGFKGINE